MRSVLSWSVGLAALMAAGVYGSDVTAMEAPTVTPPPVPMALVEAELRKRASVDPASLAGVLLTALPLSLQLMAATNLPALSKVLWSEFLDDKKPGWFTALPSDIKSYLVQEYGPSTAWASSTASSTSSTFATSTSASPSSTVLAGAALTSSTTTATSKPSGGLSPSTKIGLGVGIPLGVLLIAALLLACCLMRRRRNKRARHSERPPTPGFIPTTKRHGHSTSSTHVPLRGGHGVPLSGTSSDWDPQRDSGISDKSGSHVPMAPVVAPYHSASSTRASRSSRTSLHSVPEVPEHLHDRGYGGVLIPPPRSPRRRSLSNEPRPQLPLGAAAGVERERERERRRSSGGPHPAFGIRKAEESHAEVAASRHAHQLPAGHQTHSHGQGGHPQGQGIYAGQRNPFGNEYGYDDRTSSGSDEYMSAPESNPNSFRESPPHRFETAPNSHGVSTPLTYGGYSGHIFAPQQPERAEPAHEHGHSEWPLRNDDHHAQQSYQYGRPVYDRVYDGT